MPPFGPVKRKDLIKYPRQPGFEGPYSVGKHQFMVKGDITIRISNPHQADIRRELPHRILHQAGISRDDREKLQAAGNNGVRYPRVLRTPPQGAGTLLTLLSADSE